MFQELNGGKKSLHLKDMDSSESTVATCLQKCFLVIIIIIIIIIFETRLNVISPKASEL